MQKEFVSIKDWSQYTGGICPQSSVLEDLFYQIISCKDVKKEIQICTVSEVCGETSMELKGVNYINLKNICIPGELLFTSFYYNYI